ncbi:DUF2653 domain-containing protein [Cohnella lubricantis]|uniref:DUF2653 family protein n=1 Tax=Cohnella lubricantis TaxID=2163172 RepID=A0A841THG1_9BACL|nr:DUF2653 family protein [Cohnella lubricantis]MBB6678678.1 DUF2653 family protein [Cohnella lubricantis]MBP2118572.1 hypothetical protein [Cohnella lubricantis]
MRLTMDEIVNAVCLHLAERHEVPVKEIEVELLWDEEQGFSAEVWVQGRSRFLVEANLKEAIMRYVHNEYQERVYPSQIKLEVDDEIWADISA